MIKIGIAGYGNLGKGVEKAIELNSDMKLSAVFTRRNPKNIKLRTDSAQVIEYNRIAEFKNEIDVIINCGGSACDLPLTTPKIAEYFNVIDSFDTHTRIKEHFDAVDKISKSSKKTAIISVGWDPGLFSLARIYSQAVLSSGNTYTFWGRGVSQGHSDAVRRIDGVLDARQYTVPVMSAIEKVQNGDNADFSAREMHTRECYVVAENGANKKEIERKIKTMPNYFADYDTTVNFISEEEMKHSHSGLPHGGRVIRNGKTDENINHTVEFSLKLDSNPEFTGSILAAFARAAYRLNKKGETGCRTVLDIPPVLLLPESINTMKLL
ncbi:MAG: diaminopimelate dehydrogenase [Clostridia bacterium]|nr:diaminopimelate dehydrogenase [Clostridia bacterium]